MPVVLRFSNVHVRTSVISLLPEFHLETVWPVSFEQSSQPAVPAGDKPPAIGVMFSGGIDSAILLSELLRRGHTVVPFHILTDCVWQSCESQAVTEFLAVMAQANLSPLVQLQMPLGDLYVEHWSMSGRGVPDEHSPDEAVYLPGRNPLLLIKPTLWCQQHGLRKLALATLAANPFADARPEFFARFEEMMQAAGGEAVEILRPFASLSKHSVMQLGKELPLHLTFSCLAPVDGLHCGRCNKCAERRAAFGHLASGDPTRYVAR
jgi:7-cyano-7-deazaguanine synthase